MYQSTMSYNASYNQFIRQLPSNYKSRHAYIIHVVSQLTYPMFLRKNGRTYSLTLHIRMNLPTWLNPAITKYNTQLH
jgi:hypothetical protein